MELKVKHKNGYMIPVEVSTRLVIESGKIEGILCIVRDIRERKKKEIKEVNVNFQRLFNSSNKLFRCGSKAQYRGNAEALRERRS